MSIEYYKSSNNNYKNDGDVTLKPSKAQFKISLNGICEVEINHPYDKEGRWKLLNADGVIKSPTPFSKGQLFPIYSIKKNMLGDGIIIKARHIFFDLNYSTTEDIRAVNCTCQHALDILLQGTKYKGHSNITDLNTCYFVKQNRIEAINGDSTNTILKRWGGEIFLDNFDIYIYNRVGNDNGIEITYGKNMLDIGLTDDRSNIVTRIKPVAYNGRRLPELYVDSPLIDKYRIIYEKYIDLNNVKLKADLQGDTDNLEDDSIVCNTEEELYNTMREKCRELFKGGLDKPTLTGSVKIAGLKNTANFKYVKNLTYINLGDTVRAYNLDLGINIITRCTGYTWDILTGIFEEVVIGDVVKSYLEVQTDTTNKVNKILNKNDSIKSEALEGIINANKTQIKAIRDEVRKQPVKGMIFEDRIKGSSTYGALAIGSGGFLVANKRTADDKDWDWSIFGSGSGFNAKFITAGILSAIVIQNLDQSFKIDLSKSGGADFYNNEQLAMRMQNNMLQLFNWNQNSDLIGGLVTLNRDDDNGNPIANMPLVSLLHEKNSVVTIDYRTTDNKSKSYVEFDKYNILKSKNTAPIRVNENVEMADNNIYNAHFKANAAIPFYINNKEVMLLNDGKIICYAPIYNSKGQLILDPNAPQGTKVTVDDADPLRQKVLEYARSLIGKPYVWGGNYPTDKGTDCSGLVQYSFSKVNISLPRTTYDQIKQGEEVTKDDLKIGDLIFSEFSSPNVPEHVFIYSGTKNGQMYCIEAPHTGLNIRERVFTWQSGMRARRIIKDKPHTVTPSTGGGNSPDSIAGDRCSANIIYYVKQIEGYSDHVYLDSVSVRTLGFGLTGAELTEAEGSMVNGKLSEKDATFYLQKFFNRDYYSKVLAFVKSKGITNPLQREIDAFASFSYNLGVGCFEESSLPSLYYKYVKSGRKQYGEQIKEKMAEYCHAGNEVLPRLSTKKK